MLEFTINLGTRPGAIEISFNEKPCDSVRAALKALKMRWNGKKSVWYGFTTGETATEAIKDADKEAASVAAKSLEDIEKEFYTDVKDGYLGAKEFSGSKSGEFLYGSNLSKAIRQDLKRCGIKATARCETYSGGQSVTITLEVCKADFIPEAEYIAQYAIWKEFQSVSWLYNLPDLGDVQVQDLMCGDAYTEEQREAVRVYLAKQDYEKYWNSGAKNSWGGTENPQISPTRYGTRQYKMFTEAANKRFALAEKVVQAYHHDGSNSMVDYFDVNFYYDLVLKNVDREQPKP